MHKDRLTQEYNEAFKVIENKYKNLIEIERDNYTKYLMQPVFSELETKYLSLMEYSYLGESAWKNHTEPTGKVLSHIYLGKYQLPSSLSQGFESEVIKKLPSIYHDNNYYFPCFLNISESIKLYVTYDDDFKRLAVHGIQNFLMKYLRNAPTASVHISILDPKDRGSNIGRLKALSEAEGCKLIKVAAQDREIAQEMEKLVSHVDNLSKNILTDENTIYTYNASMTT